MERKITVATTKTNDTLSYSSTLADIHLEPMSLRSRIDYMADKHADEVVWVFDMNNGLELTYANIRDRCYLLASNFISLGLQRGDRIAYLLPNTHELAVSFFAASLAGLISVPLDNEYGSDELTYILEKTEPSAIVVYNCADYQKLIRDLFPEIDLNSSSEKFKSEKFSRLRHVILLDDHTNPIKTDYRLTLSFQQLATKLIDSNTKEYPYVDPDDVFAILFTSGTTSRPKGVECTYFSLLNSINIQCKLVEKSSQNTEKKTKVKYCQTTLIYHIVAMLTLLATMFSSDYILIFPSYKFDVVDIMRCIQRHKCAILSCLPKILANLIDHPRRIEFDLSTLRGVMTGGQLVSIELLRRCRDNLGVYYFGVAYGMTEVNIISYEYIYLNSDNSAYTGCVGKPYPFVECKIVDPETGNIQPLNTEGELHIRSFNVTRGFWNDPDMTEKFIDRNGWLHTGDIFTMDKDGSLFFKSRSKEIITVKGSDRLDVYPSIVESVLLKHPNINEAIVFGIGDNEYEQHLCSWIKLKSNEINTTNAEIISYCERYLIDYQVPRFVKFVNDFPINKRGKYNRAEMSRSFKQELGI